MQKKGNKYNFITFPLFLKRKGILEDMEERELLLNELRLMTSAEDFEKYIADASLQELRELREELV